MRSRRFGGTRRSRPPPEMPLVRTLCYGHPAPDETTNPAIHLGSTSRSLRSPDDLRVFVIYEEDIPRGRHHV